MTEAGGIVSDRTSECKHIDSVGFPIQNVEVKFVDLESNENLGPNMMGEIYVKTPRMMRGYYNDLEATRQVLDEDGTPNLNFFHNISIYKADQKLLFSTSRMVPYWRSWQIRR